MGPKSSSLASTRLAAFGGGRMLNMTPSPPSSMEVETLCFGAVSLPRVQDDSTASRGLWMGPCNVEFPHSLPLKTQPEGFGEDLQRGVDQNPSWVVYKPGDQLQETSDVCAFQQGLLHQVLSNVLLG